MSAKHLSPDKRMSTKYPRADILLLKEIFDEYDADGSGSIERSELMKALERQKAMVQHVDPMKRASLEERLAQQGKVRGQDPDKQGVFLVDFSESLFRAMDTNKDHRVEFPELLRCLYPFTSATERQIMLSWVTKVEPEVAPHEFQLSDEQRRDFRRMFRLFDKDQSGSISPSKWRHAVRRCGLDSEERDALFAQADVDGNGSIDLEEFIELMRTVLAESEGLTLSAICAM